MAWWMMQERNERLAVDSEEEWPVKQQNDPKTIFDAWEEDEEEEIGLWGFEIGLNSI